MKKTSFFIIGGDLRSVYLSKALIKEGHEVKTFLLDNEKIGEGAKKAKSLKEVGLYENIILPLPCCDANGYVKTAFSDEKVKLSEVTDAMSEGAVLIGGLVPKEEMLRAQEKKITVCDYYRREEFAVRNAALTAEAAVAIVMEMLSESINSVPVLVIGHGRIGRLLSAMLKALDAKVTVAARRYSDLAWIRTEGMTPLEFRLIDEKIEGFKAVFNTVPAPVLTKERLVLMDRNTIIIDLASEPCGTDFASAKELGITAKKALGLPGKFAPKTAGEIVKDTVLNIITEREDENGK